MKCNKRYSDGGSVRPATRKDRRKARRGELELSPHGLYVTEEEKEKKKKSKVKRIRGKAGMTAGTRRMLQRAVDVSCRKPGC
jgi:hypothetical protein